MQQIRRPFQAFVCALKPLVRGLVAGLTLAMAGSGCNTDVSKGCAEFASVTCARLLECSAYNAKYYGTDLSDCETQLKVDCAQSSAAGGSSRSSDQATSCAEAMKSATCDQVLGATPLPACTPTGTLADGTACGDSFQCQSNFCKRPAGSTCGTCTRRGKLGEACPDDVCEYGVQCANAICIPYRKSGEACDLTARCLPSLACIAGACTAPAVGAQCGEPWECSLEQAQYCDANSLTCQPFPLRVAADGEACGTSANEFVDCRALSYCKTTNGADFGVCARLPEAGQPCAGEQKNRCTFGASCKDGTCQVIDRASCK